jgi:hypothetical protein
MMPKELKNGVYILLGLLVILILVNVLVVMPRYKKEPALTVASGPKEQAPLARQDNIVSLDTLKAIKKSRTAEEEYVLYSEERYSRNPFYWPGEKPQKKKALTTATPKANANAKAKAEKPQLSMVIIGEDRKQALLDNIYINEGDTFHDFLVKRITAREVVLLGDLGEVHISLAAGSKEDAAQQKTGEIGIIER